MAYISSLESRADPENYEIFLEIYVRDIEATLDLFCNSLNFNLNHKTEDFASINLGRSRLLLNAQAVHDFDDGNPIHNLPENLPRGAGVEICVVVADINIFYERLALRSDIKITSVLRKRDWGCRDFRFVHSDGFYIRVSD